MTNVSQDAVGIRVSMEGGAAWSDGIGRGAAGSDTDMSVLTRLKEEAKGSWNQIYPGQIWYNCGEEREAAPGPPLYGHRVFPRNKYHMTRAPRLLTLLEEFPGDFLEGPCLLGLHLTHRECTPRGTGQ